MKRPVFFFHLHKCAGTFVREAFSANGYKYPSFLFKRNGDRDSLPIIDHKNGNAFYLDNNGLMPDISWRELSPKEQLFYLRYFYKQLGCRYVSSEWDFPSPDTIRLALSNIFIFTAIRSPVSRALSNWRYDNLNPVFKGSIDTFELWRSKKRACSMDNFYVRSLAGVPCNHDVTEADYMNAESILRKLDAVVVLENQGLVDLLAGAGIKSEARAANVSSNKNQYNLTYEQVQEFEAANAFDNRLYELCKSFPLASFPTLLSIKK